MDTSDIIQVIAVVVALGASGCALYIASKDRRTQLRIARSEQRRSVLALELAYALRLAENRARGGSTDPNETQRLGAEASALVSVVGSRWVPNQYQYAMDGHTPESLAAYHAEEDTPDWVRNRTEALLAVQRIIDEINQGTV